MNLDALYSDPAFMMMAQRAGMVPEKYFTTLQPQAQQHYLERYGLNRGAPYWNPDDVYNSMRVGANSGPNAFLGDNPILVGRYGNPPPLVPPNTTPSPEPITSAPDAPMSPASRSALPPVLNTDSLPNVGAPATQGGVLASGGTGATTGALSTTPATRGSPATPTRNTGNARGSSMPEIPDLSIGRPAAIGRIGAAILSNAGNGLANALGAGATAMNDVSDMNRQAALQKYQLEEERRRALEAEQAARRRASGSGGGSGSSGDGPNPQESLRNLIMARDALTYSINNPDSNLTGVMGMAKGLIDNFTGDEDAARRMILERVRIDDALLRTAQTKGAITEMEMKLFLAPTPNNWKDEKIWLDWVNERIDAMNRVNNRMATGQTVPFYSPVGDRNSGNNSGGVTIVEITEE